MKRLFLTVVLAAAGWCAYAQNYMIVDSEKIFKSIDAYNTAIKDLDKMAEDYQKQVDDKFAEIETLYNNYQQQKASLSATTRCIDSSSFSCGNEMGFGRPPANEVTSGSEAAFRMARTNDGGVLVMPSDRSSSMGNSPTVSVVSVAMVSLVMVVASARLKALRRWRCVR